MVKRSAGILVFRRIAGELEVFLVHPGGPFFSRRDKGAWTIPKGECEPGEQPFDTARREFLEETGFIIDGEYLELGQIRQQGGKYVTAWAIEGDLDPAKLKSNTFTLNGRTFPEVDRGAWFQIGPAKEAINPGQSTLIDRLQATLIAAFSGLL